ncbi:MAG: hypothetical protein RL033_85 [Pseudomonadota bacterium]
MDDGFAVMIDEVAAGVATFSFCAQKRDVQRTAALLGVVLCGIGSAAGGGQPGTAARNATQIAIALEQLRLA